MLQNKSMHENCYCYGNRETPIVEIRRYPQAVAYTVQLTSQEIVFVVKGRIHITMRDNYDMDCLLKENEFVFMPTGSTLECSITDDTDILVVRLTDDMPVCHTKMFKTSFDTVEKYESIHALQANDRIKHHIEGLISTMNDGLICDLYMQGETHRMLFLIHSYYTSEECARFFAALASPDVKFSEFVRLNYHKYRTVCEMAAVMKMSSQRFVKQFRKVFGLTPREWIQRARSRRIHWDLCQDKKLIKEIADDYGFSTQENFIRYCKQRLGATPAAIRKAAMQKNA